MIVHRWSVSSSFLSITPNRCMFSYLLYDCAQVVGEQLLSLHHAKQVQLGLNKLFLSLIIAFLGLHKLKACLFNRIPEELNISVEHHIYSLQLFLNKFKFLRLAISFLFPVHDSLGKQFFSLFILFFNKFLLLLKSL